MAQISAYIEAPSQGVTQASQQIRLPNQATALEQALVEIPEGYRKRPPLDLIGRLASIGVALGDDATLTIVEDPDDGSLLYLILNTESGVTVPRLFSVATLTPVALTIISAAQTYLNLNGPSPHRDIGITQAVDFTILCNRTAVVANDPTLTAKRPFEAMIFVKGGAFGKTYQVTVTPTGGSPILFYWTTPNGSDASDTQNAQTQVIATGLVFVGSVGTNSFSIVGGSHIYPGISLGHNGFDWSPGGTALVAAGFTVTLGDSVVLLSHDTIDFTITCDDGQAGLGMGVIKDSITLFSDLPKSAFEGFTVKIDPQAKEGSVASGAYYLQFTYVSTAANPTNTAGTYKEVVGPGSELGFDITTMPVGIVKIAGTWTLEALAWKNRTVGDELLAPNPSFVGNQIKDVGYAFERLALVSGEECFLAAVDDPFRCYPSTMTTEIDSDPISLITPGASRAHFYSIIPFNKTFILFGLLKQAVIVPPQEGPVTPTTTRLEILTSYETDEEDEVSQLPLRPTFSDRYAYYPMLRGPNYYAIYEIALDRLSSQPLSEDLTPHLPRYIPSSIDRAATVQSSFLILYGTSGSSEIYAHLFRYGGSGYNYARLQNAWHHWALPEGWTLSGVTHRGPRMHFLLKSPLGGAWIATLDTTPLAKDPDPASTIQTLLDLRVTEAQCAVTYDAGANNSTITLPAGSDASALSKISARCPVVSQPEGYLGIIEGVSGNLLMVQGDWRTTNFYVGYSYTSIWELSTIFYVGQDSRPQHGGVLGLRKLKLDLSLTSYLSAITQVGLRGAPRTYRLKNTSVGTPMLYTGDWEVPIASDNLQANIKIVNDSHLPHRVTGFEWFGEFTAKSQRVT